MTKQQRQRYREWAGKVVSTGPRYERACLEELAAHNRAKSTGWHRLPGNGCGTGDSFDENGLAQMQRKFRIVAARILIMYREGKL
ncbi:MAG: hypothetical protein FJ291_11895 [Planctomycetes bacterium]|nr:hypothetical protein [Planctomycetota bacterium]